MLDGEKVMSGQPDEDVSLPPPETLQKYNDVKEGLADRIVQMAEKEQAHRHQTDIEIDKSNYRFAMAGQVFAFLIATAGIIGAVVAVLYGHPAGATISFAGVAVVITAFYGRKQGNP